MARPLRIEFPGALYHVTSRGNAREPIFLEDPDRQLFLDTMGVVVQRHRWLCHAYCLMTNHYHLLVEREAHLLELAVDGASGNDARLGRLRRAHGLAPGRDHPART